MNKKVSFFVHVLCIKDTLATYVNILYIKIFIFHIN